MVSRTPRGTAYESFGSGPSAVVMVHGLGLNRQSWQWQVPALAARGRVITYDLHGHGDSSVPPATPTLALFSAQLAELMDHLGIARASVFGFSLGGMIARRVVQAAKDGPAATVEAALQRWFTDGFRDSHPQMMDEVRRWILANRREVYAPIYQVLVDGVTELVAPSPPITAPTLVMTGEEDYGNSPAMSRAIAAEIPGSELVILPNLRHMALAETPDLFNARLLSFLKRVQGD